MIVQLGSASDIIDMINNSLAIRKGSFFQRPDMGSDLHLLKREKDDDATLLSIPGRVKKALQWMETAELISGVSTTVTRIRSGLLQVVTTAKYKGKPITVENFYPVGVAR